MVHWTVRYLRSTFILLLALLAAVVIGPVFGQTPDTVPSPITPADPLVTPPGGVPAPLLPAGITPGGAPTASSTDIQVPLPITPTRPTSPSATGSRRDAAGTSYHDPYAEPPTAAGAPSAGRGDPLRTAPDGATTGDIPDVSIGGMPDKMPSAPKASATLGSDGTSAPPEDKTPVDPSATHSLFEQAFQDHNPTALGWIAAAIIPLAVCGYLLWRQRHHDSAPPPPLPYDMD